MLVERVNFSIPFSIAVTLCKFLEFSMWQSSVQLSISYDAGLSVFINSLYLSFFLFSLSLLSDIWHNYLGSLITPPISPIETCLLHHGSLLLPLPRPSSLTFTYYMSSNSRKRSIKLSARSRWIMLINRNVDKSSKGVCLDLDLNFCLLPPFSFVMSRLPSYSLVESRLTQPHCPVPHS